MSHSKTIQNLGVPVVVHSNLTRMLGSMTACALLSYFMYWSDKTDNPLGVYKTCEDLTRDVGLSKKEQMTARKILVNLGLITETHKRIEHKLYFKFNAEIFDSWFENCLNNETDNGTSLSNKNKLTEVPKGNLGECQKVTSNEVPKGNFDIQRLPKNTNKDYKHSEYTHDEHTQKNSQNSSDEQSDKPTAKTSSRKNFIKPTFDEVKNYFSELNNHDPEYNAHKFINYYQSINWVIGRSRTPMKDWKAAVRNWALNDSKQKYQTQGASNGTHSTRNHQSDAQAYAQELHRQYQEYYGNNGNTESDAGGHVARNVYDMEDELWL